MQYIQEIKYNILLCTYDPVIAIIYHMVAINDLELVMADSLGLFIDII